MGRYLLDIIRHAHDAIGWETLICNGRRVYRFLDGADVAAGETTALRALGIGDELWYIGQAVGSRAHGAALCWGTVWGSGCFEPFGGHFLSHLEKLLIRAMCETMGGTNTY